jgi:hypothetical protein
MPAAFVALSHFRIFNFSANHLLLISRTEHPSYAVLLMQDSDTKRVPDQHKIGSFGEELYFAEN